MEDTPRDLQRPVTRPRSAPKANRRRRWTVLLVSDDGEMVNWRWFKGWMVCYLLVLAAALIAAGVLWQHYRRPLDANRRLTREVAALKAQVDTLKSEKDLLMARVVVSESLAPPEETAAPEDAAAETPPDADGVDAAAGAPSESASIAAAPEPAADSKTETPPAPEPEAAPVIDVKDLKVSHDTGQQMLYAQFMVKKRDDGPDTVKGRTFVVLKSDTAGGRRLLPMPAVPLEDGRPVRVRSGRFFSISRFNIVKFKTAFKGSDDVFSEAAVLVYALDGTLLLEKSFDIQVAVVSEDALDSAN